MSASRDRGILAELEREIEQTEPALVAMYDKFGQVAERTGAGADAAQSAARKAADPALPGSGRVSSSARRGAKAAGVFLITVVGIVAAFTMAVMLARW